MNVTEECHSRDAYLLFDEKTRAALLSVKVPPKEVNARVTYMDLPTFSAPAEFFEVEANFPGAICLITFSESAVEKGSFFCQAKLRREGKKTLFLTDYLVSRKDPRLQSLDFRIDEQDIDSGIAGMVDVLVAVLNEELLPVLEGKTWVTAPLDWGGYK